MIGLVYMSDDFDWQIEDDDPRLRPTDRRPYLLGAFRFWVLCLAALLLLGGVWFSAERSRERSLDEAQAAIQSSLNHMNAACQSGSGDGFYARQARDPAWQAALLRPELIEAYCAGPTVTQLEPAATGYATSISWLGDGHSWQRLAFFTATPLGMAQIPGPADYWGEGARTAQSWGELMTTGVDESLAPEIGRFVDNLVATTCATSACLPDRQPFTLAIRPDYAQTADPDTLYVPSPRLLAIDETGAPGPLFWNDLQRAVVAHLTPGTIRFAVPPYLQQVINFEREAAVFMRENPDITIELVELEVLPEDPTADLAAYDGAAYTPSAVMVANGLVRDLTDYATTDPRFDTVDFYEQVWQGAWWRERQWLMPQAGQMRLLFLDCSTCETGLINQPSLRWTWAEMSEAMAALQTAPPPEANALAPTWTGEWAFLDTTRDTLLSYAYSAQRGCAGIVPARCNRKLEPVEVASALEWYRHMTVDLKAMPDVAGVSAGDRARIMVNWQAVGRQAAMWVDEPVNYEHQLQFWRVRVVPFPGSDRFDGNTPFWVHGSFISQASERPLDVWRWLVFLSNRPIVGPLRYVPARPSVADDTNYWAVLPPALREAMRTAFPFARPVSLDDRRQFSRAQLEAVVSGNLAAQDAALSTRPVHWFGNPIEP